MVVILGAGGYVGRRFTAFLQARGQKTLPVARAGTDYTDPGELRRFLRQERPDFVINAAGFTGHPNVDACESARAETLFGNTVLPLRIAEACADENIPWGHVSSGCIYQGARGHENGVPLGFREEDAPNFSFHSGRCSFYSGAKAMAEEYLQGFPRVYVWRLRIPFDRHDSPRNYLSKLLRYKRLLDVRNSLSHLDDYVAACWATMERGLPFGTYNLTNPGSVTTREVADLIRREGWARREQGDVYSAERMLKEFSYFESEEEFMKTSAVAYRSSCVLDTTKAGRFGLPLRPVREAIADSLRHWAWENPA
jgi:dTDP-4-dehydrorhamnose reductase